MLSYFPYLFIIYIYKHKPSHPVNNSLGSFTNQKKHQPSISKPIFGMQFHFFCIYFRNPFFVSLSFVIYYCCLLLVFNASSLKIHSFKICVLNLLVGFSFLLLVLLIYDFFFLSCCLVTVCFDPKYFWLSKFGYILIMPLAMDIILCLIVCKFGCYCINL